MKKQKEIDIGELNLKSTETFEGDVLAACAKILKTQPEYVSKTVERFLKELEEMKKDLQ